MSDRSTMLLQNLYLFVVMFLEIYFLHQPVQCEKGVMYLSHSNVTTHKHYIYIIFEDAFYIQLSKCLLNKRLKCKAYYECTQPRDVCVVTNFDPPTDAGDIHGVYSCIDNNISNYVSCSYIVSSLTCSTCIAFTVKIMWTDKQEYFYSEGLDNCTFSCANYTEQLINGYDFISQITKASSSKTVQSTSLSTDTTVYSASVFNTSQTLNTTILTTVINTEPKVINTATPNSPILINSTAPNSYIYNTENNISIIVVVLVIVVILVVCIIIGIFAWRRHKKIKRKKSILTNEKPSVNCPTCYHTPDNKGIISNQVVSDSNNTYVICDNSTALKKDGTDGYTTIDDNDLANMSRVVIVNTEHNTGDYTELEIYKHYSVNGSEQTSFDMDIENAISLHNANNPAYDGHIDYSDIKFDPSNTTYARLGEDKRQLTNPYAGLADIYNKNVLEPSPYTLANDISGQADLQIIHPG